MKRLRQRYIVTPEKEIIESSGLRPPITGSAGDMFFEEREYYDIAEGFSGVDDYFACVDTSTSSWNIPTTYLHDDLSTPREARNYCRTSASKMRKNYMLMAEVAAVLNQQYWEHHDSGKNLQANQYERLYNNIYNYGINNLEGEELENFKNMLEYEDEDQFNNFW